MAIKAMDVAQPEGARTNAAFNGPSVPMGDYYPYKTPHRILSTEIATDDPQVVRLRWSDGQESAVHSLMLRDRCCCLSCRHGESLELVGPH